MRFFLSALFCFFLNALPAAAHHPFEGAVLTRWYQGLLSGFAHPVIGLDHLAFLTAVAVLCAARFKSAKALAAFVPATVAGVFAHLLFSGHAEAFFFETAVALSVAVAGFFVLTGAGGSFAALCFVSVAGLFHGFAYGSGIVGAEASPLVFYITGLAAVQTAVVLAMSAAFSRACAVFPGGRAGFSRAAGVLLCAVGGALGLMSVPF
ncbi:MAG: HupE/UreJ family protein [Candidatus Dadabacteria bacterium]|nr:HupE/UreJ family protein [Candidatus Dadabacteria bacterium]